MSKARIGLIYLHLAFLFMPLAFLSTNTACGLMCSSCHNNMPLLLLYSLPLAVLGSAFFGFVGIPSFYALSTKRIKTGWINDFVKKHSELMNIKVDDVRLVSKASPVAFSFRSLQSGIFLSVGMFDVLSKKEIEAVLLHELAHIKRMSSVGKISQKLMLFSPFYKIAGFGHSREEEIADGFAIQMQGTDAYIKSARQKFDKFI